MEAMKTLLILPLLAYCLFAQGEEGGAGKKPPEVSSPQAANNLVDLQPAAKDVIKILEARITRLAAQVSQLQKQMTVMSAALNAAQQESATAVQQAGQLENTAIEEASKALKCPNGLDPDTLICKPEVKPEAKPKQ
jgi:chaperonin cofactor prefoldin